MESVIQYSQKSDYEKNREILEQSINEVLDKPMNKEEIINWKVSIKDVLLYFIKRDGEFTKNDKEEIEKGDRTLSNKMFQRCVKQAGLTYWIKMERGSKKKNKETSYTVLRDCQYKEEVKSKA